MWSWTACLISIFWSRLLGRGWEGLSSKLWDVPSDMDDDDDAGDDGDGDDVVVGDVVVAGDVVVVVVVVVGLDG